MTVKLDQSQRDTQELHSAKSRAQAETADLTHKLEEADSQLSQLSKAKQVLTRSLEEVKASLEDESRVRTKLQAENRNVQAELEQLREQVCSVHNVQTRRTFSSTETSAILSRRKQLITHFSLIKIYMNQTIEIITQI